MNLVKRIFKKKDSNNNETMQVNSKKASPIQDLPNILLEEIFIRLPGTFLCKSASLVSKRWRNVIQKDIFWIEKSIRDKRLDRRVITYLYEKKALWPKRIYFDSVFNRNLIKKSMWQRWFHALA